MNPMLVGGPLAQAAALEMRFALSPPASLPRRTLPFFLSLSPLSRAERRCRVGEAR